MNDVPAADLSDESGDDLSLSDKFLKSDNNVVTDDVYENLMFEPLGLAGSN